jgi:hypothetical protein
MNPPKTLPARLTFCGWQMKLFSSPVSFMSTAFGWDSAGLHIHTYINKYINLRF